MSNHRGTLKRSDIAAIGLAIHMLFGAVRAEEITLSEPVTRAGGDTNVLHFPSDQCVGNLHVPPESVSAWDSKRVCPENWEYVGVARGDVTIPSDRAVLLVLQLRPRPGDPVQILAQNHLAYQMLVADRTRVDPDDLSGLSSLGPDDLYWLLVTTMVPRTDADRVVLEPIRRLTGLQMLSLNGTGVTDKGMEDLRALRSLKGLVLRERSVGNAGLAVLKDLPALEYLDLDTEVTDAGIKEVAHAGSLRWLRIRTGGFWGPGLAELAQMPRLERLCLWGNVPITDRHVAYLESLTRIKSLTLWGSACDNLTDASLASIGKLQNLEELYFIRTSPRLTPAGVAHLKDLKYMKAIAFSGALIVREGAPHGDAAMRQLAAILPGLESIEGTGLLSPEGVKALATFQNLRHLSLSLVGRLQGYDGPTGLSELRQCSSLEELHVVGGGALSDADRACVESLTHLKTLSIVGTRVTDRDLASISELDQLERLYLAGTSVTRSGLNQLRALSRLRDLDVQMWVGGRAPNGIDELTLDLSGLQDLKRLRLSALSLQESDLAFLPNLRHLKQVMIDARSLPAASLQHLKGLSELERLSVRGLARPTDQDLATLAGLARVKDLTLGGEIPDTALTSIEGLAGLQSLTIETSKPIRSQTITDIKQRHPTIGYIHVREPLPQPTVSSQRPGVTPPRGDQSTSPRRRREQPRRRRR